MQWRKRAFLDAYNCLQAMMLPTAGLQQTDMSPSAVVWSRITHISNTSMMSGIFQSRWLRSSQTNRKKRVVRNCLPEFSTSPITCGGLLQPVMVMWIFYVKNGSQSYITLLTSTSGQGTLISTSAATDTFHLLKLKRSVGLSLAAKLT